MGGEYPVQATTKAMRTRTAKRNKKKELGAIVKVRAAATALFEAQEAKVVALDLESRR